jgi:hypothetical protein
MQEIWKNQSNKTPLKAYNFLITKCKDIEVPDKEFKILLLKMIDDIKEDSIRLIK